MHVTLEKISVRTHAIGEFVEITSMIDEAVARAAIIEGVALVRSRHTTAAITCNEPDPRLHQDMVDAMNATFPTSRRYQHIEEGVENAGARSMWLCSASDRRCSQAVRMSKSCTRGVRTIGLLGGPGVAPDGHARGERPDQQHRD